MTCFKEIVATRFSDTDALGHINNTMLPIWFEGARDPIFKFFMPDLDLSKWSLILAKIEVSFLAQLYYGEPIEIRSYISRIGNSSFDVYQEAWQQGKLCASGKAVMVHFDYKTNQSASIPNAIVKEMEKHLYQGE